MWTQDVRHRQQRQRGHLAEVRRRGIESEMKVEQEADSPPHNPRRSSARETPSRASRGIGKGGASQVTLNGQRVVQKLRGGNRASTRRLRRTKSIKRENDNWKKGGNERDEH